MTTYAPPPGQSMSPPPTPPKKRHRVLLSILGAIGGLVLLGIVLAATDSGGTSTPTSTAPSSPPAAGTSTSAPSSPPTASTNTGSQVAGIGTPVRDGKFEFVVTSVTYAKSVGDQFLNKTAQGRFVLLHLKVTNIGNQSQSLTDMAQFVYDSSGRKYSADSTAGMYINGNNDVFYNDINPGNTVRGVIAFDMPRGVTPVRAELHDSLFSGGVSVSLR